MPPASTRIARMISQLVFLSLFMVLLLMGNARLWIVVFGIGILASFVFSRIYCGWMCPINTLLRPINWIYAKAGVKRRKAPQIQSRNALATIIVAVFVLAMVATQLYEIKIPVFPLILVVGIVITLLFEEELFHKYLCPFGVILRMTSSISRLGMTVRNKDCVNCYRCIRACPNGAIFINSNAGAAIDRPDCLVCFRCQEVCPNGSFQYGKITAQREEAE